jgi:hypothetical protein
MMEECVRVVPTPGNCSMAMTLLNDTRQRANPFQRINFQTLASLWLQPLKVQSPANPRLNLATWPI